MHFTSMCYPGSLMARASFFAVLVVSALHTPEDHLMLGNNALAVGQLDEAITHFEACLETALEDSQEHQFCQINLASALVDLNDVETDDESEKKKRAEKAIELLRNVLRLQPKHGDAAFNLGLLLQEQSQSEDTTREAASLYEIAVRASDAGGELDRWDAYANLASARQELKVYMGDYGAIRMFERSIVLLESITSEYESHIDSMLNTVDAEYHMWQNQVNDLNQYLSKLYYGYAMSLTDVEPQEALSLMSSDGALILNVNEGVDEESAQTVLASNAKNALRLAVDLDSNNAYAVHMLASMGEDQEEDRASSEFVEALFDDFAATFDERLSSLEYKVPSLIGEAAYDVLQSTPYETFRSALDAGAGTGLAGRFLRPLVSGPLVAVDLSQKMLDLAAKCTLLKGCGLKDEQVEGSEDDERSRRKLYDKIVLSDLETVTLDDLSMGKTDMSDGFDLIVAADVLVYVGDLSKLFTNMKTLANPSEEHRSYFVFSCEKIDEQDEEKGWKLNTSGRYGHSRKYIEDTLEPLGYDEIAYREIVPRKEKGEDVKGHMFIFGIGGAEEVLEEFGEDMHVVYNDPTDEL